MGTIVLAKNSVLCSSIPMGTGPPSQTKSSPGRARQTVRHHGHAQLKRTPPLTSLRFALPLAWMFVAAHAPAPVVFSDTFSPAPSAFWGDEVGAWTASGGAYFATAPNNNPNAISSLPYNLTDFSVDFDVNNVTDGGIFLRASVVPGGPAGVKGILLNLKVPAGGPRIYWHVFTDGTNATPGLNLTNLDYGPNPHVHVEVSGDTYSAFINGSPTPTSTLTTNIFPAGRVALGDQSPDRLALIR
jgi:hypothetical protein